MTTRAKSFLICLLLALLPAIAGCRVIENSVAEPPATDGRLDWWRDARFGLFIHWGLYAIPAGEWNGETDYGEWIRANARIPLATYEELRSRWNPARFDADEWARIASDAGVKYVVVTTKHHDGFALFDSKQTDWDVMSTPWKHDVMGELSRAFARQGLVTCWYHSIMDWHHPDYLPRREFEKDRPVAGADFDRYERFLHAQVEELLTHYGPIGVMWFDGEWESTWNHERGARLYDLCRRLQPGVIVNNRVDVGRSGMAGLTTGGFCGDFGTPEQEVPATGFPGVDWESCLTMNRHWGYNAHDKDFKSTRELLRTLVDIASKGGNFLLNVGPTARGEFPPECVERLAAIGRWMKVNGRAIHGTQASPIEAPAFGRITQRIEDGDTHLFLHVFDWPANGSLAVEGFGNECLRAGLLAAPGRDLPFESADGRFEVRLPAERSDPDVSVVEVVLRGSPIVYAPPRIQVISDTFVQPIQASFSPKGQGVDVHYTLDGSEPRADSPLARAPISISDTTTIRARAFRGTRAVSAVVERRLTRVALRPALEVRDLAPGLVCRESHSDGVTTESAHSPRGGGEATIVPSIAVPRPLRGSEHVFLDFRGYVRVHADDVYRFDLKSDDGSRLWIDGALVCDNDGVHGPESVEGSAVLASGWHAIEVAWFNRTGTAALSLTAARIGDPPGPIDPADLAHPE